MDFYYKTNDWERIESAHPTHIDVNGFRVPYAVFENEPEKTLDTSLIANELERATSTIWTNSNK